MVDLSSPYLLNDSQETQKTQRKKKGGKALRSFFFVSAHAERKGRKKVSAVTPAATSKLLNHRGKGKKISLRGKRGVRHCIPTWAGRGGKRKLATLADLLLGRWWEKSAFRKGGEEVRRPLLSTFRKQEKEKEKEKEEK